jgi:2-polyprenyl-6-methoxyphenol hydroxylase-like FAD-dependent oxidoreductase
LIAAGRADVAVVGGGPAGAVTALLLARAGRDVVLYQQSHDDALRLGETLPPSVNPLRDAVVPDGKRLGGRPSLRTIRSS